jgi:hypothetical protein
LGKSEVAGIKAGLATGVGMGFAMLVMFGSYGLAMWYGSVLVAYHGASGGSVVTVIFAAIGGGRYAPDLDMHSFASNCAVLADRKYNARPIFLVLHVYYVLQGTIEVLNPLNLYVSLSGSFMSCAGHWGKQVLS